MADTNAYFASTPSAGQKRSRDDGDDGSQLEDAFRFEKRPRPGSGDSNSWPQDSVLNTPTTSIAHQAYQKPKYDSDDQSSMISEPGSPQDITMSSGDEAMGADEDTATFSSQSPEEMLPGRPPPNHLWQTRPMQQLKTARVPTPILPPSRPGARPMQIRTGAQQHIRRRHPQEILSSPASSSAAAAPIEHLEVPSPIDEDEVPTPPSAAEAAGSQLSMLTVNDMDIEPSEEVGVGLVPTISISPSQQTFRDMDSSAEEGGAMETMDEDGRPSRLIVRKQRQRSGALSSGQGSPTPSPVRQMELGGGGGGGGGGRMLRGFSMGWRADCEKCRMRVPGHMNHFIA